MSRVLLHGITYAEDGPALEPGFEDRPLRRLTHGSVSALVADHPSGAPDPRIESLREYGRAIERLTAGRTLLPARFATVLPDDDSVLALLRDRQATLLATLGRVRGAVELGVRATFRDGVSASADSSQSGGEYLAGKLAQRRRARDVSNALDPLARIARGSRQALAGRAELSIVCAYLVDRDRVAEFVARVTELDTGLDDVELACTGPWPPYSFTEAA